MKPRIGVYLSKRTAARLTTVAKHRELTKSALVEAALDRFFEPEEIDAVTLGRCLSELSCQISHLDRDLKIVNETVALHARFHLAVTPEFPAETHQRACELGSARFEELAAQVGRRIERGTLLMQETIGRVDSKRSAVSAGDREAGGPPDAASVSHEPNVSASTWVDVVSGETAAAQEVRSTSKFAAWQANPFTEASGAGVKTPLAPRGSASARQAGLRQVTGVLLQNHVLIMRVFLPFVAGYFLSYLFRTINALIAAPLISELGLGAGDLGLLTSVYFLTFAAAQIPIGVLLDRYGPRRIQSALLVAAAAGAALFAVSDNFLALLAGRALMGLGVAAALTAGLKALVLWFPKDRVPLLNGLMVMFGALGAVTATSPADLLLDLIGWRELFGLFAAVTAGCAAMIYLVVPEAGPTAKSMATVSLKRVYTDPRFWRLAPLSATSIGTAWALHGLWAAQWLRDVEGLDRTALVWHLFIMAVAVSLGALLLGIATDRLGRRGIGPQALLGIVATISITAQLALILRLPLPSYLLWAVVAAVGAATVLSYASLAEYVPKELAGRANGLLNFFHIGAAFALQTATGLVLAHWVPVAGRYPEIAYQAAFALNLMLQIAAGVWFGLPWLLQAFERNLHFLRAPNAPAKYDSCR